MSGLEDLRNQIKIRGLKESGFSDPVTEFKGIFADYEVVPAVFQGVQQEGRNNVVMHFTDVEVMASESPYPYPTKDITISYSESAKSRWGVLADSMVKFLTEEEGFNDLKGRRLHLKIAVHKLYQGKEKGEVNTNCWTIVGVEGKSANRASASSNGTGGMSVEKQLLLLLNGKTEQQFSMEVLKSESLRNHPGVQSTLLDKTLVKSYISRGLVSKDDAGLYSLTPEGVASLQG